MDKEIAASHDLLGSESRRKTKETALEADAIFMAIPCESTTRAGEKPIPGRRNPPAPLRSHAEIKETAFPEIADKAKVEMGNVLIDFPWG